MPNLIEWPRITKAQQAFECAADYMESARAMRRRGYRAMMMMCVRNARTATRIGRIYKQLNAAKRVEAQKSA
jgi:hypothetical protein